MKIKEHIIGSGLLILFAVYFYAFSDIYFSIFAESTVLTEFIFLLGFIGLLILASVYYCKNSLLTESILLTVFTLLFTNSFVLGLLYYPLQIFCESSQRLEETVDRYISMFFEPFDILYSYGGSLIMILASIIPVGSLVIIIINRKRDG